MNHYAPKPAGGKPAPRVHQLQGKAAPLPMHIARAPVPAANDAPTRNPRNVIPTALRILYTAELSRDQLAERLAGQFPGAAIEVDRLIHQLVKTGDLVKDRDSHLLGLTLAGAQKARQIERERAADMSARPWRTEPVPAAPPPVAVATVAMQELTRSPAKPSSDADNRPPPVRAGAEDALGLPSRIGDKLHYRSGLITDMAGNVLQAIAAGAQIYRPTRTGEQRASQVWPSNH
jgi:hypothetical protein